MIRGFENEIRVSEGLATDIQAGRLGRWSGHTHPPGWDITPSTDDRSNLPFGQKRSAVWGDGGWERFHRTPQEDRELDMFLRREQWRQGYGQ